MPTSPSDSQKAPNQDTAVNNQVVIPSSLSAEETAPSRKDASETPIQPSQPAVDAKPKRQVGKIMGWIIGIAVLMVIGWLAFVNWSQLVDLYTRASAPSVPIGSNHTPDRNIEVNPTVTPSPSVKSLSDAMAEIPQPSSFKPSSQTINNQNQSSPAALAQEMDRIATALQNKDGQTLYAQLSSQLTAYFTPDSVTQAFASSGGSIIVRPIGDPEFSGEWARQLVSYGHNGAVTRYYVVFHLENGSWKLFGTMPAS